MSEGHITIEMSMPPGVNKAYDPVRTKTRAKFIKNDVARAWADYARNQIILQAGHFKCPNKFRVMIQIPETRLDTDAPVKETIDALKTAGLIVDDRSRYNQELVVQIVDGLRSGWMRVTLWSLPDDYTPPCVGDFSLEGFSTGV